MAQASSQSNDGFKAACARIPWEPILRVLGGVLGILIIILGFVGIFTASFDPRSFVNQCYQVIFGTFIVLAEMRMERWLRLFTFLTSYAGLGLFYIFVGGLALGGEWYEYILAILFLSVGIVYVNYGCCARKSMYAPKDSQAAAAQELKPAPPSATPASAFTSATGNSSAYTNVAVRNAAPTASVQMHFDDNAESAWPEMDKA